MDEADEIYVENLKEALNQLQRYLVVGLGAALFYFVLCLRADASSEPVTLPVPGISISTDAAFARMTALVLTMVAGMLASWSAERAGRITAHITARAAENPVLRRVQEALRTYPSIATDTYPAARVVASLTPAVLIVAGRWQFWGQPEFDFFDFCFATFVLISPYLTLFFQMWAPPYAEPRQYLKLGDE